MHALLSPGHSLGMDTNDTTETNDTNQRDHQWETTGEQADELTPQNTGRWLITTQGTVHLWDLDQMTYVRMPSEASKPGSMGHDHRPVPLTRAVRWPKIGECSCIWYDDPDSKLWEHWRISSEVQKIERLADTHATTDPEAPS